MEWGIYSLVSIFFIKNSLYLSWRNVLTDNKIKLTVINSQPC